MNINNKSLVLKKKLIFNKNKMKNIFKNIKIKY